MQSVQWKIGGKILDLSHRGLIIGVLNVTPDSFSDAGAFASPDEAVRCALQMVSDGADIIDIGGESTRPGSDSISSDEELRRLVPVFDGLRGKMSAFVSIDTSKADVAAAALDRGATIINDVTGGRGDEWMMKLIAEKEAAFVIMHMRGEPKTMQIAPSYGDVVAEVANFFRQQYERAIECGVDPMAIAFDPGIGFGKTLEHNLELLGNLDQLRVENRPLVVGVSRKAFLGKISGISNARDRLAPTVALTALLRAGGARVFRVHDVKENVAALRVTEAVLEH
jgi:dihydropteroate synthase